MTIRATFLALIALFLLASCAPKAADARPEDTGEPRERRFGYISMMNTDARTFALEECEWLTKQDSAERLAELGIEPNDLPNGFYVHSLQTNAVTYHYTPETQFRVIDWEEGDGQTYLDVTPAEFSTLMGGYRGATPFWIETADGEALLVEEQYLP